MTRFEQIQTILNEHPLLHDGGYGSPRRRCIQSRTAERAALLTPGSVATIDNVTCWLALWIQPIQTINHRHTSYGLKHVYERATGEYCSNGQFITAALIRGYEADLSRHNASFAMSERSIRRAWEHAHNTPMRWAANPVKPGETRCANCAG